MLSVLLLLAAASGTWTEVANKWCDWATVGYDAFATEAAAKTACRVGCAGVVYSCAESDKNKRWFTFSSCREIPSRCGSRVLYRAAGPLSTITTTTPSGLSFYLGTAGSQCPSGHHITTRADCLAAHRALSITADNPWDGNSGGIPAGCSTRPNRGANMHWNAAKRGRGRGDLTPVCKKHQKKTELQRKTIKKNVKKIKAKKSTAKKSTAKKSTASMQNAAMPLRCGTTTADVCIGSATRGGPGTCEEGKRVMTKKACKEACLELSAGLGDEIMDVSGGSKAHGRKFMEGSWRHQPGCFITLKGPWRPGCSYNKNKRAPEKYQFGVPVCKKDKKEKAIDGLLAEIDTMAI